MAVPRGPARLRLQSERGLVKVPSNSLAGIPRAICTSEMGVRGRDWPCLGTLHDSRIAKQMIDRRLFAFLKTSFASPFQGVAALFTFPKHLISFLSPRPCSLCPFQGVAALFTLRLDGQVRPRLVGCEEAKGCRFQNVFRMGGEESCGEERRGGQDGALQGRKGMNESFEEQRRTFFSSVF